ncbi:ornithine cyclodeaminase family protein [Acidimangrovimonas sediminis]|uniref:ornithine cyclodeaminase family protein n=1 Tax=Acidimangrovimonas sediminis TaxID=2056283 RepID=UPI000C7F95F2|nr:ornithine cyclodeaminase family protein [Acidimangrovimonas sediminis]
MTRSMLWLNETDLRAAGAADHLRARADIEEALRLHAAGAAEMVPENVLPTGPDPREKAYGLPARLEGEYGVAGLKWTMHRAAADPSLPANSSLTLLNRLEDGQPEAILESGFLTCMRTAAVTGLALSRFAPLAPRRIALLGAGAQARGHLDMLAALFPEAQVTVWNRTTERAHAMAGRHPGTAVSEALDDAVADVDAILSCTSAPEPILDARAVRPGRLIAQIGFNEVSFDAIEATDDVCVDAWGDFADRSAKSLFRLYRAGRFSADRIAADLSDPACATWRPDPARSVFFSSFGLNIFDIALAARLVRDARALGLGQALPLAAGQE